jgi:hypothetical protein
MMMMSLTTQERNWLMVQLERIEDGSAALAGAPVQPAVAGFVPECARRASRSTPRARRRSSSPRLLLLYKLTKRLSDFIDRSAPRIRDDTDQAEIRFTLFAPQLGADDMLYLDYRVTEELSYDSDNGDGGTVPGVSDKVR